MLHHAADNAGPPEQLNSDRAVACPTLVLWSAEGLGRQYDVEGIWRRRAPDFAGAALDCGHFVAEERPDETAKALATHLS